MKKNKDNTELNSVLAQAAAENFCLYYSAHAAHVNITGRNFYADHKLLGKIYEDFQAAIDTFGEFQQARHQRMAPNLAAIEDASSVPCGFTGADFDAEDYLEILYDRIEAGIGCLENLYKLAESAGDYALSGLAQERLARLKKHCWMLRAQCDMEDYDDDKKGY